MNPNLKYSSIEELQDKAGFGDVSKNNVKQLLESSKKLISKARVEEKADEESAYINYFKFMELQSQILKRKEFKDDWKYFDGMYDVKKNQNAALKALDKLTVCLESKYQKKKAKQLASVDVTGKDPSLSEDVKPKKLVTQEKDPEVMTYKDLNTLISQKSTSFLLMDTRPEHDYQRSHLIHPYSMNIPAEILSSNYTASSIGKKLKLPFRSQWERRDSVDKLILLDWNSKKYEPGTAVTTLRTILNEWDRDKTYKCKPVILEGGFEMFRMAFPHRVSDPKYGMPANLKPDKNANIPNVSLDSVVFPKLDHDKAFLVTPSPSPKSSLAVSCGAVTVSKEVPEVKYPSLSDLKSDVPVVDRGTKPTSRSSSDDSAADSDSRDAFNNARLSGISQGMSRIDSASTIASTSSTTSLNKAILGSTNGSDISSTTFDTTNNDFSTFDRSSTFNSTAGDPATPKVPRIDRSQKASAEALYSRARTKLDLDGVIDVETKLADLSLDRRKENLNKEIEWRKLCQQRDNESSDQMREMLNQELEAMSKEIEQLTRDNQEKDAKEKQLMEELKSTKMELKRQATLQKDKEAREAEMIRKEEEKAKLGKELQDKRRERKRAEEERKKKDQARKEEERRKAEALERRRQEEQNYRKERLKEEGSSSSKLRRSYSSPNIADMDQELGKVGYNVPVPKIDRGKKPSSIVKRDFAGVWGSTRRPGLTGLRNLGNTCYMNSILQCVSNTEPLVRYFITRDYENDLNRSSDTRGEIAIEFSALLTSLWANYKSISPTDMKAAAGRFKAEFSGRDQQDSHEFASKLLEWLHDDTNKIQNPSKMPEIEGSTMSDEEAGKRFWSSFLNRNQSIIVQLFYGLTKQTTVCIDCGARSVKFQEFYNLGLFIPNVNRINLTDCLRNYVKEHKIDSYKCEKCRNSGAVQKMEIVRLPPILIIHLERFYPDEQMFRSNEIKYRKKQNFVNFELTGLNLEEFVVNPDNKYKKFDLYAVSNHFGSLEGGHYTAYCHSNHFKRWYKYDDQDVTEIEPRNVESSAAYILFYSAVNSNTSLLPLGE